MNSHEHHTNKAFYAFFEILEKFNIGQKKDDFEFIGYSISNTLTNTKIIMLWKLVEQIEQERVTTYLNQRFGKRTK